MHRESRGGAGAEVGRRGGKVSLTSQGRARPSHEWGPGNRCVRSGIQARAGLRTTRHQPSPGPQPRASTACLEEGLAQVLPAPGGGARADVVNFTTPAPMCSLKSQVPGRLPQPGAQDRILPIGLSPADREAFRRASTRQPAPFLGEENL